MALYDGKIRKLQSGTERSKSLNGTERFQSFRTEREDPEILDGMERSESFRTERKDPKALERNGMFLKRTERKEMRKLQNGTERSGSLGRNGKIRKLEDGTGRSGSLIEDRTERSGSLRTEREDPEA